MWCNKRSDQVTHNFRGESEIIGLGMGERGSRCTTDLLPLMARMAERSSEKEILYCNAIKKVSWYKQSYCV